MALPVATDQHSRSRDNPGAVSDRYPPKRPPLSSWIDLPVPGEGDYAHKGRIRCIWLSEPLDSSGER